MQTQAHSEDSGRNGGDHTRTIRFGDYSVNLRTREVHKHGVRIRLPEKPFLVLAALLESPGDLVTREELRHRLWADDTFVDFDNNLNSAVATLRDIFGDSARSARFIETLPRLGYRFIGTVERKPAAGIAPQSAATTPTKARRWLWPLAVAALLLLSAALIRLNPSLPSVAKGAGAEAPAATSVRRAPSGYTEALYLLERGDPDGLQRAANLLQDSVTQDPNYAPAHAALADAWIRLTLQRRADKPQGFANAERSARRSLQLDSTSSSAYRTLALVLLHRDWSFAAADQASRRAVDLGPEEAANHLLAAMTQACLGHPDEAVAAARRAIELDPASWRVRADLAFFLLAAGRWEEAAAESRAVLELEPENRYALDFWLAASERLERFEDARKAAVRLLESSRATRADIEEVKGSGPRLAVRRYREWQVRHLEANARKAGWPPTTMASIYATAGQTDRTFEWLERAYHSRDCMLVFLTASPDLVGMRRDPRFARLAHQMGLPLPQPLT